MSIDPDQLMFVDGEGRPVGKPDVAVHLRMAKTTRVSIEGNSGICRGLLKTRYGDGITRGTLSAVTNKRKSP